ncbi:MAG TPA: ABC transporter permease [Bacteroidales bacterium]|nr:ABC transporter permease [Bacteroidales bacterium]
MFKKKQYAASGSLSKLALRKLSKDRIALVSVVFIVLLAIISILGYLITPDPTPFANQQFLELTTKKPGFKVQMLSVCKNEPEEKTGFFKKMLFGEKSNYQYIPIEKYYFQDDKIFVEEYTGMTPNDGEIKSFSFADVVYALSPGSQNIISSGNSIIFTDVYGKTITEDQATIKQKIINDHILTKKFLLGTDRFGRDVLSQVMIGTRVSLSVGFISVFISLLIGIFLGALAGYFKGWVDNLIMWFINVVWSIPTLLLVIAITFVLGKGFWQVFIAVGLTMWVEVARVVRGQFLSIREKEFVEAGVALGFTNSRIIFRHILPNVLAPVIVISAANFASAILIEAGLSFLGIGVQPPMPSWGTMIKEHYGYIILDSAYLAIVPGIAIMLTVLSFMLTGNGLRDAMDVKIVNK